MSDNVQAIWTDTELDETLAAFTESPAEPGGLDMARARVLAELDHPQWTDIVATKRRHRRRRILAAAAAVGVLGAAGVVAQAVSWGGHTPTASAAAAEVLHRAAAQARIGAQDEALTPGHYRYIEEHAWWESEVARTKTSGRTIVNLPGTDFAWLAENVLQTWQPPAADATWLLHRKVTGKRVWLKGTEKAARAAGVTVTGGWPSGTWRARCGDFELTPGEKACVAKGNWQDPKPDWIAGLPRDPQKLYERLRADAPKNGLGDAEVLVYAADALRSGLLPADLRAALYQALEKLPGLQITEHTANLDGRVGTALGMTSRGTRQDIIIDPKTGAFIGERTVLTKSADGLKAGTVTEFTSVSTRIVSKLGATK